MSMDWIKLSLEVIGSVTNQQYCGRSKLELWDGTRMILTLTTTVQKQRHTPFTYIYAPQLNTYSSTLVFILHRRLKFGL